MLGRSVKFNRHRLEHLDVSYNSLDQRACQVLANGAATNRHLRHINVDGNALGVKGNMALIGAIQRSVERLLPPYLGAGYIAAAAPATDPNPTTSTGLRTRASTSWCPSSDAIWSRKTTRLYLTRRLLAAATSWTSRK